MAFTLVYIAADNKLVYIESDIKLVSVHVYYTRSLDNLVVIADSGVQWVISCNIA